MAADATRSKNGFNDAMLPIDSVGFAVRTIQRQAVRAAHPTVLAERNMRRLSKEI